MYSIDIGRSKKKRDLSAIKNCLPLKIDYDKATNLTLENKDNVVKENVKLIWKPFYVVSYNWKRTRVDPRKQKRTEGDSDSFVIDGLSANVLQPSDRAINTLKKLWGQSDEDSQKIKENDIFLSELEQEPEIGVSSKQSSAFEELVIPPKESKEQVEKRTINYIMRNPKIVYYKLKRDEDNPFADQKEFEIRPSLNDIKLSVKLIYVPKWEMEFQSKDFSYTRKVTGNSGKIIYDTISNCNKHWNVGFGKKNNIAACDICGEVLCKEHVWKCTTCGSWRCESHSKTCTSCQRKYCPEHITIKCTDCKSDVCDSCSVICPICGESHCKKDMTKCSKCEKIVCVSCTRKDGGILSFGKKILCKNC